MLSRRSASRVWSAWRNRRGFACVGVDLPRRSGAALLCLVDVGGRQGGGLVLALEVDEGDVVADDVLPGVNAVSVVADGAFQAAGEGVVAVDDLARGGDDIVGRGEGEGARGAPAALAVLVLAALLVPSDGLGDLSDDLDGVGGGDGRQDEGNESGLHCDLRFWKGMASGRLKGIECTGRV